MQTLFISYLLYTFALGFASHTYYFINKVQISNEQGVYLFICPPFIWAEINKRGRISFLLYYSGINLLYFLIILGFRLVPFCLIEDVEAPPNLDDEEEYGMAGGLAEAIAFLGELAMNGIVNLFIWIGAIFTTIILPFILSFIYWLFQK